jgi:selenide,water dikinase
MMTSKNQPIRLTQYSHGAGCGCKIAPAVLDEILSGNLFDDFSDKLLVGNQSRDDAAVYDMGNGEAVISTTDFFMPIVDDPTDFGRIAATNAISDIYAMGGEPIMAIAILGWPVALLDTAVARDVINGARSACRDAGIILAGGHSIDAPEPIFGLAVTGRVQISHLKRNDSAQLGDRLYLTKPLGIGILTTAEKKSLLKAEHQNLARDTMCQLNKIGALLAKEDAVNAMTDVTGFGLLGHLTEMAEGSKLTAKIQSQAVPLLEHVEHYLEQGAVPGGTERNFASYGHKITPLNEQNRQLFCDPQTSGGLLLSVSPSGCQNIESLLEANNIAIHCIGEFVAPMGDFSVEVE